jgi:hypothetical protein
MTPAPGGSGNRRNRVVQRPVVVTTASNQIGDAMRRRGDTPTRDRAGT